MGAAVVAIIAAARRRVLQSFRAAGATAPNRAQSIHEFDRQAQRQLRLLVAQGVVRESEPGRFYLDEPRLFAWQRRQRRLAFVVLAVLLVVTLGIMLFSR
jgi:hypothetical protein